MSYRIVVSPGSAEAARSPGSSEVKDDKQTKLGADGSVTTTTMHSEKSTSATGRMTTVTKKTTTTTRTSGRAPPQGPRGAMNAFKQMDHAANPQGASKPNFLSAPGSRGGGGGMNRSPSAIKEMLLRWIQAQTREYEIDITNYSTSWADGMAFCALIHHFYPEAFDYAALNPKQRRKNFTIGFDAAEQHADIAPLLDVEDMVRMKKPDWKCVFTYVQSFYRHLKDHERAVGASSSS